MVVERQARNINKKASALRSQGQGLVAQTPLAIDTSANAGRRKRSEDQAADLKLGHREKCLTQGVIDLEQGLEQASLEGGGGSVDPINIKASWMPPFKFYYGGPITYANSASETLGVALGILRAGSLPIDVKNVLKDSIKIAVELAQFLILAGTRALCLHGDLVKKDNNARELDNLLAQEMEAARLAREIASRHRQNLEKSEELRMAAKLWAKKAEDDLADIRLDVQRQLEDAEQKGYDYFYSKLTSDYQQQVQEISQNLYFKRFKARAKWCHSIVLELSELSEDSALRVMPDILSEELVMPDPPPEEENAED